MASTTSSTATTPTTLPACVAPDGIPCNDGDPCTDDVCTTAGCDNLAMTGLASVTCTCERPLPDVCIGQTIPRTVQRYTTRACRLFDAAVDAPVRKQRRRLRQGARALRRAVSVVVRAQVRGLAPECAAALADQYRTAGDQAAFVATQN